MSKVVKIENIIACVFDAYGTLFDVNSAADQCKDALGDKGDALSSLWRVRQLEYTWLRSLMNEYVEFWQITGDGLDYAMEALDIEDAALRERLMNSYLRLGAYPEVKDVLTKVKAGGFKTAILSNGSPKMLHSAIENSDIESVLDDCFSVDSIGVFKPHPSVYQIAVDGLEVEAGRICFMSSNAWDVAAAANFGFRVIWVNRFRQPQERIPGQHEQEITTLGALPQLLGL